MAKFWGKDSDDMPEELKGLTPKQIADAVRESAELKTQLTETRSQFETAKSSLESLNTEHTDLKSRLDALEASRTTPPPEKKDDKKVALTDFLVDGDRAFAERAMPIAHLAMETKRDLVKSEIKRKLGPLFTKWEAEIDALAATVPLLQQCQPNTWEYLFYSVKGRHAEEKDAFVVESVGGHHREDERPDPKASLTPQEKVIAKKMGIKEEDYLKQKQGMREGIPAGIVD
jgi:hypothetical protein